jgi:hypothetical protein
LSWLGLAGQGQAWDPFVKVSNVRVNFHVEMNTTPTVPRPTAPWYAYFPSDPRMMPAMQTSPYPSWPVPFPPPGAMDKRSSNANFPPGPMVTQHWPNYYQNASAVQPVGYSPASAPSYWYQGR